MDAEWPLIVAFVLGSIAAAQAILMTWHMAELLRFVRGRLKRHERLRSSLRVELFAPCKGWEPGLKDNLRALLRQDHPNYGVTFIVESPCDPAVAVIDEIRREHENVRARLVVAGIADGTGQKVHNLYAATADLDDNVEVLAFVDSDARPRSTWLRALAARVDHDDIVAVTGYRWFVPMTPTPANYALSILNGWVAGLLGPGGYHLVWGGSWAIQRKDFDEIGLRQAWLGTLSDDLVASSVLHQSRRRVEFDPACLIASPLSTTWPRVFDFARRQYLIGKFYQTGWWLAAYLWTTFSVLGCWAAIGGVVMAYSSGSAWATALAATTALLFLANTIQALCRRHMAELCVPEQADTLRPVFRAELAAWPLLSLVMWAAMFSSLFGRTIHWRSITYVLGCGGRIARMDRERPLAARNDSRVDPPQAPRGNRQRTKVSTP